MFMVDKDTTQIKVLRNNFEGANVLLFSNNRKERVIECIEIFTVQQLQMSSIRKLLKN